MRNNIISLKEYFYFTYPLVMIWTNRKNYCTQIAYRSEKLEIYFCKGMILFLIYLEIYFLADKVECHKTKFFNCVHFHALIAICRHHKGSIMSTSSDDAVSFSSVHQLMMLVLIFVF